MAFNGAGIGAAGGAVLVLAGNDLARQLPRLVTGDLVALAPARIAGLRDGDLGATIRIETAGRDPQGGNPEPTECPY